MLEKFILYGEFFLLCDTIIVELINLKIKTGYLYHIKDEYFDVVNDDNLMQNHERGKKRPTYFTIKDKEILWFIPISSKVEKYKK